jgi:spermidine synthase
MFAKMALPLLGGVPAVWNTCMLFFQATLLGGYAYAHVTTRVLRTRPQALLHLALLLISLFVLPIGMPAAWSHPSEDHPIIWLLALLLAALGLPFFVLSATAPLVQAWFARTDHPMARDPYFLYVASNSGSLTALMAYPLLLEPYMPLAEQSDLWTIGYLLLMLLLTACTAAVWRGRTTSGSVVAATLPDGEHDPGTPGQACLSLGLRTRYVVLAFIPSSLMLGLTTYITTNVAPVPLLWVAPLALYLLSFVIVFAKNIWISPSLVNRLVPILILPVAATLALGPTGRLWLLVPLHLLAFFVTSLACHRELAQHRPAPSRLTEFYLLIGVGGVVGGIFNALVAPTLFTGVFEYPLVLVVACLVRRPDISGVDTPTRRRLDFGLALAVCIAISGSVWLAHTSVGGPRVNLVLMICLPALLCFAVRNRPLPFGVGVGTLLITTTILVAAGHHVLYRHRSFFGVLQVINDETKGLRILANGTTSHGSQSLDPATQREPLAYFYRTGPIGQVFATLSEIRPVSPVAVIGLGTGSLACYGKSGQEFTFYEIDPAVVRIARDPRYFTFLQLCPPDIQIVVGDARLSLATAPDRHYGLIVLDAFSSDAIPSHLITRQALRLYLQKLTQAGVLAVHISNNHLDLEPIVANLAHDSGLVGLAQQDLRVTPAEARAGKTASHWVVLARRSYDLHALRNDPRWHTLAPRDDQAVWTDDFSNILSIIKWR